MPTLRSQSFIRFSPHHRRVELPEQRAEVYRRVHHDPVGFTLGSGNEAIQTHGNRVTQSSAHGEPPTKKLIRLIRLLPPFTLDGRRRRML